jgi:hypothetical protein
MKKRICFVFIFVIEKNVVFVRTTYYFRQLFRQNVQKFKNKKFFCSEILCNDSFVLPCDKPLKMCLVLVFIDVEYLRIRTCKKNKIEIINSRSFLFWHLLYDYGCVQVRSLYLTVGAEPVPPGPVLIQAPGHQHAAKGTVFVTVSQGCGSGYGSGFNRVSGSGSGFRRAKMAHKSRNFFKVQVLDGLF